MERQREDDRNGNRNQAWTAMGVLAGLGALAGGAYLFSQRKQQSDAVEGPQRQQNPERRRSDRACAITGDATGSSRVFSYLSTLLSYAMPASFSEQRSVPRSAVPANPDLTNLNALLSDIFVRFVQLKDEDFQLHYKVFINILLRLHESMQQVDVYYGRYSSTIQFSGSHYDGLRIKKPDEFDMNIVIGLPLNIHSNSADPTQSDIFLEPKRAGYIQLKMGVQYLNLPFRDGREWLVNKAAYEWRDDRGYLLRSNFINWFKGVIQKGLNIERTYVVDGVPFTVRTSESGPAATLIIENRSRGFKLDVDLVPALRFPESRWPVCRGYRAVPPAARRDYWVLVPKANKVAGEKDQTRSWRIALQDQERAIMKNLNNCKLIIRLLKKLRDAQNMKRIASYYVKTLFLWEIIERDDPGFWRKSPAELFKIMVTKFYNAMISGSIPYFWNKDNNLIEGVERSVLKEYAGKLASLLQVLEQPTEYKQVARWLLSREEFKEYNAQFLHI